MLDTVASLERFLTHVDSAGEHHPWTGSTDPRTNTGQFRLGGKLRSAQRAAWELQIGPLPSGVRVRTCPTDPRCVRIEHLTLEPSRRRIAASAESADDATKHMSVSAAFPLYLAYLQRHDRTESTITVYDSIFRRWIDPMLGSVRVNELGASHTKTVIDEMRSRAPSAAAVAKSILKGLSEWATDEGL